MTPSVSPHSVPSSRWAHCKLTAQAAFLVLAAAFCSACGAAGVTRGADLYASGHYIEAAEVFEHTERRLSSYDAAERARYGLYRGAALLSLGDVRRATHWLAYAEQRSRSLSEQDRAMLRRARLVAAGARRSEPERLAASPSFAARGSEAVATPASY